MFLVKRKVSLWAYLFLFLLTSPLFAQNSPAWERNNYFQLLTIESYSENLPFIENDPHTAYLSAYKSALANILLENPSSNKVQQEIDEALSIISTGSLADQLKLYYSTDLQLLAAYIELKNGNELKFMWMMNDVYRKAQQLVATYPDFIPGYKIAGTLNVLIGTIPDQYQWILNLLGYQSNPEKGIIMLERVNQSDLPVRYESLILTVLLKNYLALDDNVKSLQKLEKEILTHSNLSLLKFVAALSHMKLHQSQMAKAYLLELQQLKSPYINYLLGESFLHAGEFQTSISYYKAFIKETEGSKLVKDAYFKIYISHYIMDNSGKAEKFKQLALQSGSLTTEADKNANQIITTNAPAHPIIFKIRYLTDGGYYKEALKLLENTSSIKLNTSDQIELVYRSARLFHLSENHTQAIDHYLQSIELSDGRYFAPNAALQLGFIYLDRKNESKAKFYFEKALTFKNYTYVNSIKGKAKQALKNLKQ